MGTPNFFAYIMLLLFVPLALAAFGTMRPALAAVVLVVFGEMFLPEATSFNPPIFPEIAKDQMIYIGVLLGAVIYALPMLLKARPGTSVEVLALVLMAACVPGVLNNQQPLVYGPLVIPGTTNSDIPTVLVFDLLSWFVPFFVGRALLRDGRDLRTLMRVLMVGALIYSALCLVEIRLSPQLHNWVYGLHPAPFSMTQRFGGYRPVLFMPHGLATAIFMAGGFLAANGMARTQLNLGGVDSRPIAGWLGFVLVIGKSAATIVYAFALAPVIWLLRPRHGALVAVFLVLLALGYPALRTFDLFPIEPIVDLATQVDAKRGESIGGRFRDEKLMLDKAQERFYFGWGGYARYWVYDPDTGKQRTVPDGYWIVQFGNRGAVGFLMGFGIIVVPVLLAARRLRYVRDPKDRVLVVTLMLIVAMRLVDWLPNGHWGSMPVFLAGALHGTMRGLGAKRAPRAVAAPTETAAPPPLAPEAPPASLPPRLSDLLRPTRGARS